MANFFKQFTYPHSMTRVKDESIREVAREIVLPLHRPIFPIRAAKGKVNEIVWVNGDEAIDYFGDATFDTYGPYFRREQVFLQGAVFPNQACFCVRLADPDAEAATFVLEAHVTEGVEIQQYERDANGGYVYDSQSRPIPKLDGSNNPIKEPGVTIRHVVRPMASTEKLTTIQPKTVEAGGVTTVIYPLAAGIYTSVGDAGNRAGFRFYYDLLAQDEDVLEATKSLIFSFSAYEKPYDSDIAAVLRDRYQNSVVSFVMKPDQVDKRSSRRISAKDILKNNYVTTGVGNTQVSSLPFSIHFYADNFKIIGELVKTYETNSADITDGWMADILSCVDQNGNPYHHTVLDISGSDYALMSEISTHYFSGGDDGDLTDEKFEELYRQFLSMDLIPEVQDYARYPITHLYDVGYSFDTKMAAAKWMANHDHSKYVWACQDDGDLFTMEQAVSAGQAIRTRAAMTPESEFWGTGACRGDIFAQSDYLNDSTVNFPIPATYWICMKRSMYHNTTYIKGEPKGEGNHEVTIFQGSGWVPYTPGQKQLLWENGLNYYEVKNMVEFFYADLRSIYKEDSSLLSNVMFTDVVVYSKYITDKIWAKYAGVEKPLESLYSSVKDSMEAELYKTFGQKYRFVVTVYKATDEQEAVTTYHIRTEIYGPDPARCAINDLIVRPESAANS